MRPTHMPFFFFFSELILIDFDQKFFSNNDNLKIFILPNWSIFVGFLAFHSFPNPFLHFRRSVSPPPPIFQFLSRNLSFRNRSENWFLNKIWNWFIGKKLASLFSLYSIQFDFFFETDTGLGKQKINNWQSSKTAGIGGNLLDLQLDQQQNLECRQLKSEPLIRVKVNQKSDTWSLAPSDFWALPAPV